MALTALDLGLRGAVVGLFLVVCVVLLRSSIARPAATLGVALGLAGAAYAISTAPFFPRWSFGWNSPFIALAMGSPVIFWLWARAVFEPLGVPGWLERVARAEEGEPAGAVG